MLNVILAKEGKSSSIDVADSGSMPKSLMSTS
jgi:hypothetical protein